MVYDYCKKCGVIIGCDFIGLMQLNEEGIKVRCPDIRKKLCYECWKKGNK